ncbi:MAG TPA: hypothetical protein VFG29_00190 [Syntrophales bacterium]|nr:hypothetical protein [Syntrophales bacterium]
MRVLTVSFIMLFLMLGCQNSGTIQQHEKNAGKGEKEIKMAEAASIPSTMRPPIDLAQPARTETATFALG